MSEYTPKVSVIVPCHNGAAYLGEALDSLLAQNPMPWEVIVIDDGSTDGSAAIAEAYGAPVVCRRQDNQGIAGARNHGLRLARGDLIAFLDADDIWPPDSLIRRLLRLEEEPDLDGVFGLVESFVSPELPEADRRALAPRPGAMPGRLAQALLVRREVFERIGCFDPAFQVGENLDWIARAKEQGVLLGWVDAVVLRRRIHGANTVRKTQRLHADYLRVLKASLARRRAGETGSYPPESGE